MLRDASHSVGPDVGDLFASLKARLTDTNKNLVAHAVTVFGAVAAAMGGPCERQTRGYMEDIFKCLSDNKPQVGEMPYCYLNTHRLALARSLTLNTQLRASGRAVYTHTVHL